MSHWVLAVWLRVGERMLQRWAGGQPGRREWEEGRKEREVMTGYFSPFPLLTADVISHSPRTRSRSNLRLLWTALLKPHNQMKTFITCTLHGLLTYTHAQKDKQRNYRKYRPSILSGLSQPKMKETHHSRIVTWTFVTAIPTACMRVQLHARS